ncbi:MAG TPA: hypothetical protein VFF16_17465 [Telluria sp.]|nr:hypothetical protein [Telluria sp.]
MNLKPLLLATLLASLSAGALAEDTAADDKKSERTERGEFRIHTGPGMADMAAVAGAEGAFGLHGRTVKNAPYSATIVNESQQTLADGNQIANKTSMLSFRDSAGRTRQEIRDPKGEVKTVIIRDDAATYILHPEDKTATKVGDGREMAERARAMAEKGRERAELARERAEKRIEELRKEGKLGDREFVIKRVERVDGEPGKSMEDVRIRVMKDFEGKAPEMAARIGPVIAHAFGDMKYARNATTKDLGTKDISGVKATGKLRSYEIPAGEMGNKNPIVVADETWYSPDLQVTVYQKHSDPRSGERVYRLENLKRDEPAAALFAVPSDYKVKDVMANIERRIERVEIKK